MDMVGHHKGFIAGCFLLEKGRLLVVCVQRLPYSFMGIVSLSFGDPFSTLCRPHGSASLSALCQHPATGGECVALTRVVNPVVDM